MVISPFIVCISGQAKLQLSRSFSTHYSSSAYPLVHPSGTLTIHLLISLSKPSPILCLCSGFCPMAGCISNIDSPYISTSLLLSLQLLCGLNLLQPIYDLLDG